MRTVPLQFETFDAFSPYSDLGPYRAADYWQLPEGEPCELLRGRFVMSPSPTSLHQTILLSLSSRFGEVALKSGGAVFFAPMDVILADDTILQPDLLYIAKDRREIIKQRVEGPPDLVIEILSPGTERRDRLAKLDLYARYGVSEYWIVDPEAQLIEFLLNEQGRYVVLTQADDQFQSPRLPEISIQLADFWKEVAQRLA